MLITLYTTSSSVISGLAKWLPASIHACLQDCFTAVHKCMYDEIFSSSQFHFFTIIMIANKYLCTQIHNSYYYDVKLMCLIKNFFS